VQVLYILLPCPSISVRFSITPLCTRPLDRNEQTHPLLWRVTMERAERFFCAAEMRRLALTLLPEHPSTNSSHSDRNIPHYSSDNSWVTQLYTEFNSLVLQPTCWVFTARSELSVYSSGWIPFHQRFVLMKMYFVLTRKTNWRSLKTW